MTTQKSLKNSFKKEKMNRFEIHVNRSKHQVLGRKLKSDQGLPGISKHKAIQKRKKTLLQEYKMKNKVNQFIDQRIGERNRFMTEDDKIMARFTAERKRMFNRKAMFNLSEPEVLTHRGQTLSEIERFEDVRSDDEEEDFGTKGTLKRKFVEDAHFGGGTLTKSTKDRESLIDELINESKKRKVERQRNKEETLEETEQLDEKWKTLGMIVTSTKDEPESEPIALKNSKKSDDFDFFKLQLKFEPQGQASQRLKTDEEVAKEDREKLEHLEQERQKQINEIRANENKNFRSADDLDDGMFKFGDQDESDASDNEGGSDGNSDTESNEEEEGEENEKDDIEEELDNKEMLGNENSENDSAKESIESGISMKENSENEHETLELHKGDEEKDEKSVSEDEGVASDDDAGDSFDDDDEDDDDDDDNSYIAENLADLYPKIDENEPNVKESNDNEIDNNKKPQLEKCESALETIIKEPEISSSQELLEKTKSLTLDIPYVIKVPENYAAFKELIQNYSPEDMDVVIDRLIKCNHPNLHPENKHKMLKLSEYLIKLVNEEDLHWDSIMNLVPHFNHIKEFNREACLSQLLETVTEVVDKKDFEVAVKFVVWYILLFIKPEGAEVLLPISKPMLSVACLFTKTKMCCPKDKQEIYIGLLCSYLLLQDAKTSDTLYIHAINFLMKRAFEAVVDLERLARQLGNTSSLRTSKDSRKSEGLKSSLLEFEDIKDSLSTEEILHNCLNLLSEFVKTYRKFPETKILFKPLLLIRSLLTNGFSTFLNQNDELLKSVKELSQLSEVFHSACLPPLSKAVKRPKALRQYEPSFHAVTYDTRHQHKNLSEEKKMEQKLLHKYKTEKKGAMRELRRDRVFLTNIKLKEKALSDEMRLKKVKEIFGDAATQQGELRKMKRKK